MKRQKKEMETEKYNKEDEYYGYIGYREEEQQFGNSEEEDCDCDEGVSFTLPPELRYYFVLPPELKYNFVLPPELRYNFVLPPELMYKFVLPPELRYNFVLPLELRYNFATTRTKV